MKINSNSDLNIVELDFILNNLLKIGVFSESEKIKKTDFNSFFKNYAALIESLRNSVAPLYALAETKENDINNRFACPDQYQKVWSELTTSKTFLELAVKSSHYSLLSQRIVFYEVIFLSDPAFGWHFVLSHQLASLIKEEKNISQYPEISDLLKGKTAGTFCLQESNDYNQVTAIGCSARLSGKQYLIRGKKISVPAGQHNLTESIFYLVSATLENPEGKNQDQGLFLVPHKNENSDNFIISKKIRPTVGLDKLHFGDFEFGHQESSIGYLIDLIPDDDIYRSKYLINLQFTASLFASSVLQSVYNLILGEVVFSSLNEKDLNSFVQLNTFNNGVRGMVYYLSFLVDCQTIAKEKQREKYNILAENLIPAVKIYLYDQLIDLIKISQIYFIENNPVQIKYLVKAINEIQSCANIGGTNQELAEVLVKRLITDKDNILTQTLMEEFNGVETSFAKTGYLRNTIGIWRDFIGGFIILAEDLKLSSENPDSPPSKIFSKDIIKLLVELIICFELIKQGLEAEKKLADLGISFDYLKEEAKRKEEVKYWYNRLICADYFATFILSKQENFIRLMQKSELPIFNYVL